MSRAFIGALNAAVPGEAESTGPWRARASPPAANSGDNVPGDTNDAALSQARQKPPNRVWRCDQRIGARSMATIVTTDSLTICPPRSRIAWQPLRMVKRSMSPEELRERLERAGLTPYRLSYLLGVEPNEGSKWTRGGRPVPEGRVAQIIELTDFVAEHGAAAVPLPALVRTANARPRLVRPAVTGPEPVVSPHSPSRDGRPSTPYAGLRPETRAGFGPLHSDFVRAHNLASQRGFER